MDIIVQKFGGTSVSTEERRKQVIQGSFNKQQRNKQQTKTARQNVHSAGRFLSIFVHSPVSEETTGNRGRVVIDYILDKIDS